MASPLQRLLRSRESVALRRSQDMTRTRQGTAASRQAAAAERQAAVAGREAATQVADHDPFWHAQLCVLATIILYLLLPGKLTLGPSWLLPTVEGLLLVGLVASSPTMRREYSPARRNLAIALIGLVTLVNFISMFILVHYLLRGGKADGHSLILAGMEIWVTNALLFGIWYWELDRGGPVARELDPKSSPDWLFPQMADPELAPPGWMPGFIDFLYVSFTNQTAFSPTDAMPLSQRAKLLMTVQALASLVTVGLVVARAVNILS